MNYKIIKLEDCVLLKSEDVLFVGSFDTVKTAEKVIELDKESNVYDEIFELSKKINHINGENRNITLKDLENIA